jgi:cytochrome b561
MWRIKMANSPTAERYDFVSIVLHWLMLALLAGVYLMAELQEGEGANSFATWHYSLGLSVFILVWVRIVARLIWHAPGDVEQGWRNALSKVTHGALYVLMIGMPTVGWLILSAEGDAISFFGLHLPPLVAPNHGFAETLEEIHEIGGTIGYALVGLHAGAALFHHYVLRDGLMSRMLPRRASNRP